MAPLASRFLIVESGSNVPCSMNDGANAAHCIAQEAGEEPGAFLLRILEQIARIESAADLGSAVVVCSPRSDDQQLVSRELAANALASAMLRARGGRITFLCATGDRALLENVQALAAQLSARDPRLSAEIRYEDSKRGFRKSTSARSPETQPYR
jgi:hypothetical protein